MTCDKLIILYFKPWWDKLKLLLPSVHNTNTLPLIYAYFDKRVLLLTRDSSRQQQRILFVYWDSCNTFKICYSLLYFIWQRFIQGYVEPNPTLCQIKEAQVLLIKDKNIPEIQTCRIWNFYVNKMHSIKQKKNLKKFPCKNVVLIKRYCAWNIRDKRLGHPTYHYCHNNATK